MASDRHAARRRSDDRATPRTIARSQTASCGLRTGSEDRARSHRRRGATRAGHACDGIARGRQRTSSPGPCRRLTHVVDAVPRPRRARRGEPARPRRRSVRGRAQRARTRVISPAYRSTIAVMSSLCAAPRRTAGRPRTALRASAAAACVALLLDAARRAARRRTPRPSAESASDTPSLKTISQSPGCERAPSPRRTAHARTGRRSGRRIRGGGRVPLGADDQRRVVAGVAVGQLAVWRRARRTTASRTAIRCRGGTAPG